VFTCVDDNATRTHVRVPTQSEPHAVTYCPSHEQTGSQDLRSTLGPRLVVGYSGLTLLGDANHPTLQQRNKYPQRDSPPAAVRQVASDFGRVKKFQQFQGETVVNHELTDKRVHDDQLQPLLNATHSGVCGPHSIDPQGYFSCCQHSWSSYGSVLLVG
jgi:hypothetical protein